MAPPSTSLAELKKTARLLRKHKGDRNAVAAELGLALSGVTHRVISLRRRLPNEKLPPSPQGGRRSDPETIAEAVNAVEKAGGNVSAAARSLGVHRNTFVVRLMNAETRSDWKPQGRVKALAPVKRALPKAGEVARYIITAAQSDTKIHEPTWSALSALAAHHGAEIMVSTFEYRHNGVGSVKRGTGQSGDAGLYDQRIEPFVVDDMVQLAPGLVFNGNMNILPTATDPLSGLDSYNGRNSGIFPHAKVSMRSIASPPGHPTKFQYTTGATTQLRYIQRKAGQKAEFDHVFGGLIVEVASDGSWWVRQLNTDKRGRVFDLDLCVVPDNGGHVVVPSIGAEAIVWGDIHTVQLEPEMEALCWGEGGILDTLRPTYQFHHDLIDFESRGHHNRRDPHKMFELFTKGRGNVATEVAGVATFLARAARPWCKDIVVPSNHDAHIERWLREADWREDPENAEFYHAAQGAYLKAIKSGRHFNALQWAVSQCKNTPRGIRFLAGGESFTICKDASGGIEMALHGDKGPNGSRGSIRNLARLGRKVCIGHSHSAGIHNGAYQSGVTAKLGMDYARGAPSSWSQSCIVVHPSGKRQIVTIWKGRWRA